MDDLDLSILAAWQRLRPALLADPSALVKRLSRRTSATMKKPPRAWCLAIRASDTRITAANVVPSCDPDRQQIQVDAALLRKLCKPVRIDPPGQTLDEVAKKLGTTDAGLTYSRVKGILRSHYVPGLGGRRGKPAPLLYTDRPLDPAAKLFDTPDPLWGWTANHLPQRLPDDFTQTLTRVAVMRPYHAKTLYADNLHPELQGQPARNHRSMALPQPPPDYVWYKWKGDQYMGYDWRNPYTAARYEKHEHRKRRARENAKARRRDHPPPSKSQGTFRFRGYNWLCPMCARETRILFLPLPPLQLDIHLKSAELPAEFRPARPPLSFACTHCHRVRYFSRVDRSCWTHLIAYLTGGLLYGHEVPKPAGYSKIRKRPYRPNVNRAPSHRRQQVLDRLLKGMSYKQIAAALGVGYPTVHVHAKLLYKQHNVHGRAELIQKLGLPLPPPRSSLKREAVRAAYDQGLSTKQIAHRTNLTLHDVRHHIKALRRERNSGLGVPPEQSRRFNKAASVGAELEFG